MNPGDRRRRNGREFEWVHPGWWQPILTAEESRILASGKVQKSWEPTEEEIESAQRYAEDLLGGKGARRGAA